MLKYAAAEAPSNSADRGLLRLSDDLSERQTEYLRDAGLAPLLYRATRDSIDGVPSAYRDLLLSADLTAQVRHGNLIDAAKELIDVCELSGVRVTLLKGISISDQHYPAAHLRPMGDIDVLIPECAYGAVESAMLSRGYTRESDQPWNENADHGPPLFHRQRRVWLELHTALFPKDATVRRNGAFSPAQIAAQSVASTFHGRPVYRLTDELQLAYIASFWIQDLSHAGFHPSLLPPLFDAVYLLRNLNRTLDWDGLLGGLDNDMAIASLYIMLVYLSRRGLHQFAPSVLSRLAASQKIVGAAELSIIHAMLDNYLIRGKPFTRFFHSGHVWNTLLAPGSLAAKLLMLPWNIIFPPHSPDRYTVRYQKERIKRLQGRV